MSHADFSIVEHEFAVKPRQIERALADLWRATADDDSSLIHVRMINLILFAPATHATPALQRALEQVSVEQPGRTIALLANDSATGSPRADVSIACRVGGDRKQICGELIKISGGEGGAALPSLAASLLVPGVPTCVWWLGDARPDDEIWSRLTDIADRVIVDSRTWRSPVRALANFAAVVASSTHVAYTDLQWVALTSWRRMIAQSFDMRDAQPYLRKLTHIDIVCGTGEGDQLAALLLVGWLASRLGWQVARVRDGRMTMITTRGDLEVRIDPHESAAGIVTVELHAEVARFTLESVPERRCIRTAITLPGAAPIQRMAQLGAHTLGDEIGEDLNMVGRDTGFEAALAVAAEVAARMGPDRG